MPRPQPPIARRSLLRAAGAFALAPALVRCASLGGDGEDPFTLGVAAGEPRPDGFVLWTRLAPQPLSPDPALPGGLGATPVEVEWEIAGDEALRDVIRRGAAVARPEDAHSVHVEIAGLAADRPYWYRFRSRGFASRIGRARTAPAPGVLAGPLRLACFSCANWQHGYYAGYRQAAADAPDLALFLGDYIYEYIDRQRTPVRAHSDGVPATDLRTYRNRYAQYKTDPDLQAIHAAAPALVTWDDHEVQNDYAGEWSQDLTTPAEFLRRRAAAYRAFWEHMPLPEAMRPRGPDLPLHRALDWGRLARLWMLDERQYRSRRACYGPPNGHSRLVTDAACPELNDPARSMLGAGQEAWLARGLAATAARWNILAQGVVMAPLVRHDRQGEPAHWTDDWEGYPAARERLLRRLHETRAANPVVFSGDIHSFWANDLRLEPGNPASPAVAAEFVTTSVSSLPSPYERLLAIAQATPDVRFFESRRRGYLRAEVSTARLVAEFRAIADPLDAASAAATLARFVVEDGSGGLAVA